MAVAKCIFTLRAYIFRVPSFTHDVMCSVCSDVISLKILHTLGAVGSVPWGGEGIEPPRNRRNGTPTALGVPHYSWFAVIRVAMLLATPKTMSITS